MSWLFLRNLWLHNFWSDLLAWRSGSRSTVEPRKATQVFSLELLLILTTNGLGPCGVLWPIGPKTQKTVLGTK